MTTDTLIKPDAAAESQLLHAYYLTPVIDVAQMIDPDSFLPTLAVASALNKPDFAAYMDVITDVVVEAYHRQLKRLPVDQIVSITSFLNECAQMKTDNEPFALDEETLLVRPHIDCLRTDLIEQILEELDSDSVFKSRPFILYYALTIMQVSVALNLGEEEYDYDEIFSDTRLCIDRARLALKEFQRKKEPTHKQIARKGGKARSEAFDEPKQYVRERYQQLLTQKPSTSKRQAAKIITEEAYTHPLFKGMSQDNLFDTLYKWLCAL